MEYLLAAEKHFPAIMLAAGIALILTPRWVRWAVAGVLILFGMLGLWPELIPPAETA